MLKKILIVIGSLFVLFLVVGLMLPGTLSVERSVVIAAEPGDVLPHVSNLKAWPKWSYWTPERDPECEWTFTGPETGAGAKMIWQGAPRPGHGAGELTVTQASEAGVQYDMSFEGMDPVPGTMAFTKDGEDTNVVWSFEMDAGIPVLGGYLVLLMRSEVEEAFDEGLENLKTRVESKDLSLYEAAAAAEDHEEDHEEDGEEHAEEEGEKAGD